MKKPKMKGTTQQNADIELYNVEKQVILSQVEVLKKSQAIKKKSLETDIPIN